MTQGATPSRACRQPGVGLPRVPHVLVAAVGVADADGCDQGVHLQLPVSAHLRKSVSPHEQVHGPMRARTRTWQRFGGLSLPLPT